MHLKITELIKQAGLTPIYSMDTDWKLTDTEIEKLVMGVVQECITICDNIEDAYLADESLGVTNHLFAIGAGVCCNKIKTQFGVDE